MTLQTILMILHVLVAFALIGLILLQHGRGADSGAAFGSGASSTVFGARGSANFLSRTTAVLAIVFFSNSLVLAHLSSKHTDTRSLMEQHAATGPEADTAGAPAAAPADVPAAPAAEVPQAPAQ